MGTNQIEYLILKQVNISRRKQGLTTLRNSGGLRFIARRHSGKMALRGRIWHGQNVHMASKYVSSGFLESLFGLFIGLSSGYSGENVAMMPKGNVRGIGRISSDKDVALALHKTWMKSPGHRKNILDGRFNKIGIGVKRRGNMFYATQVFYG